VKSAVETLNPTRVKLTVEVPYEELKPSLDAAYKSIATQVNIPGFRRGHVPARIIDQRVGRGAVLEEAVNEALPRFYGQAVEENQVRPVGQPTVDVTDIPTGEEGGELKFTAEVDVRPTIELPDYSALAVTVDDVEVSDEDVDQQVTTLQERFGTLVGLERAAADGDFVSIDLAADIEGEEIDAVKGVSYEIGTATMIEGLDEALIGKSAGDSFEFDAPLAGGDRAGESSHIQVTLNSVKERELPTVDDDFAQLASEFDTLEELRADLRTQAEQNKRLEQGIQARDRVLDALLEASDVPIPEALIEAEVHSHLENEGRLDDHEHGEEVGDNARKGLQTQFLLDAIVEHEKVSVAQPELIEYLVMNAAQYGMEPNEFAKAVEEAGQVPAMVGEVARRKALALVLEKAVVTDASGRPVDLEALRPTPPELPGQSGESGETELIEVSAEDVSEAAADEPDEAHEAHED
jgi:trigger factor